MSGAGGGTPSSSASTIGSTSLPTVQPSSPSTGSSGSSDASVAPTKLVRPSSMEGEATRLGGQGSETQTPREGRGGTSPSARSGALDSDQGRSDRPQPRDAAPESRQPAPAPSSRDASTQNAIAGTVTGSTVESAAARSDDWLDEPIPQAPAVSANTPARTPSRQSGSSSQSEKSPEASGSQTSRTNKTESELDSAPADGVVQAGKGPTGNVKDDDASGQGEPSDNSRPSSEARPGTEQANASSGVGKQTDTAASGAQTNDADAPPSATPASQGSETTASAGASEAQTDDAQAGGDSKADDANSQQNAASDTQTADAPPSATPASQGSETPASAGASEAQTNDAQAIDARDDDPNASEASSPRDADLEQQDLGGRFEGAAADATERGDVPSDSQDGTISSASEGPGADTANTISKDRDAMSDNGSGEHRPADESATASGSGVGGAEDSASEGSEGLDRGSSASRSGSDADSPSAEDGDGSTTSEGLADSRRDEGPHASGESALDAGVGDGSGDGADAALCEVGSDTPSPEDDPSAHREPDLIELPEVDLAPVRRNQPRGSTIRAVTDLSSGLRGAWRLIDAADNAADFAPGGFDECVIGIDSASGVLQVYRAWGRPPTMVVAGHFLAEFLPDGTLILAADPDRPHAFSEKAVSIAGSISSRDVW